MTGNRVRKMAADGLVTTMAGSGREGSGGDDGPAADAELNGPHSLVVAKNGDILVADTWNNRVRKIDAKSGRITNFAGTGARGSPAMAGRPHRRNSAGSTAWPSTRRVRRSAWRTSIIAGYGRST